MYEQRPFRIDGKYYAKIDGKMIEVSEEVARVMDATYKRVIYQSQKWSPEDMEREDEYSSTGRKIWRRKTKWTELPDCVLREDSHYDGIQNMADSAQPDPVMYLIHMENEQALYECMLGLNEREQRIVDCLFFEGMHQNAVAEMLGISHGRMSQIVSNILRKMRKMMNEHGVFEA